MNTTILALTLVASFSALASPRLLEADDAPRGTGTAREKLVAQLSLLEEDRPHMGAVKGLSIGGVAAVAGGGLVFGLGMAVLGTMSSLSNEGEIIGAFLGGLLLGFAGAVIAIAGGVLLLSALVKFLITLKLQSNSEAEINDVKQRLEELDRNKVEEPVRSLNVERRTLPPGFVLASF